METTVLSKLVQSISLLIMYEHKMIYHLIGCQFEWTAVSLNPKNSTFSKWFVLAYQNEDFFSNL